MNGPLPDIVQWVLCLAALGALAGAVAYAVIALRRRSFAAEWAKVAPIINGVPAGGLASSAIKGVYLGHPVRAALVPGSANTPGALTVELQTDARGQDWAVVYGRAQLLGTSSWHIQTRDPALAKRLAQTGVLAEAETWPEDVTIRYNSATCTLAYTKDRGVLSPERFREHLDLLVRLEGLTRNTQ
jgi:hypothetical protein